MRRFTVQLENTRDFTLHAHICSECCVQWECRLPCFIEWLPYDNDLLGHDVLGLGEDTLCQRCVSSIDPCPSDEAWCVECSAPIGLNPDWRERCPTAEEAYPHSRCCTGIGPT